MFKPSQECIEAIAADYYRYIKERVRRRILVRIQLQKELIEMQFKAQLDSGKPIVIDLDAVERFMRRIVAVQL